MSKKDLERFMARLQDDAGLGRELQQRLDSSETSMSAADLIDFAAGKGYRFDASDTSSELNDEQLDAVAGGMKPRDTLALRARRLLAQ